MNRLVFFEEIIKLSMAGSILALAILIIKIFFKDKLNGKWNYYIWILLILRLMFPYTPELKLNLQLDSFGSQFSIFSSLENQIVEKNVPEANIDQEPEKADKIIKMPIKINKIKDTEKQSYSYMGMGIDEELLSAVWYFVGILIVLFLLLVNLIHNFKVRRLPEIVDAEINELLISCIKEVNVKTNIKIINSPGNETPCIFGLIRPRLLLSQGAIKMLSKEELRFIFIHELVHLRRKDLFINWIIIFVGAVYWFNPIIWYSLIIMKRECEISCDEGVLKIIKPAEYKNYIKTIINSVKIFSRYKLLPGAKGIVGKSEVKRRIVMITKYKERSIHSSILAIVLSILITGLGVISGFAATAYKGNEADTKIMKEYTALINQKKTAAEVIRFIDKNISLVSKENAGKMVNGLEAVQKNNIDRFANKFYDTLGMQEQMTKEFRNGIVPSKFKNIKDKKLRELLLEVIASGYKIETAEGSYFPVINYEFYKKYNRYLAEDMKSYINIMAIESNITPVKDAGLMISWKELFNRALGAERFMNTYRSSVRIKEVKALLNQYFSFIIFGLNNTPLFSYEKKVMVKEARDAYEYVIRNNSKSEFVKKINSYYNIIRKNNFKLTSEVIKYRNNLFSTKKF